MQARSAFYRPKAGLLLSSSLFRLPSVRSFGTEDRQVPKPIPPRAETYEFIIFRGSDIKDLHVSEIPAKTEDAPQDPAIVSAVSNVRTATCGITSTTASLSTLPL